MSSRLPLRHPGATAGSGQTCRPGTASEGRPAGPQGGCVSVLPSSLVGCGGRTCHLALLGVGRGSPSGVGSEDQRGLGAGLLGRRGFAVCTVLSDDVATGFYPPTVQEEARLLARGHSENDESGTLHSTFPGGWTPTHSPQHPRYWRLTLAFLSVTSSPKTEDEKYTNEEESHGLSLRSE